MATYYANVDTGAGSILATNAWSNTAAPGGTPATFADGNAAGHTLDLNGLAMTSPTGTTLTCALLQASGGAGTLTPTGTLIITGKVKYTGTLTTGMIVVGTGASLTIQPGTGAGTNAVENTSSGYAVLTSGTGTVTVTNSGGYALYNTSTGRALNCGGTATDRSVTGVIYASAGRAYYQDGGKTTFSGNTEATAGYGIYCAGGTVDFTGMPGCTPILQGAAGVYVTSGTLNWIGTHAISSGYYKLDHFAGTTNLGTSGTPLAITNSGAVLVIQKFAATFNTTYMTITNSAAAAQSAVIGVAFTITGASIPSAADTRYGVTRGWADGGTGATTGCGVAGGNGLIQMPNDSSATGEENATSDALVKNGMKYGSTPRTGSYTAAGGGLLAHAGMTGGMNG